MKKFNKLNIKSRFILKYKLKYLITDIKITFGNLTKII